MKRILIIIAIVSIGLCCNAQQSEKKYYLYHIVSFSGNINKEGIKVNVDDGKEVETLKDASGAKIRLWEDALVTYRHNHKNNNTLCADLANLKAEDVEQKINHQSVDVIIGGLPCQGFSKQKMK